MNELLVNDKIKIENLIYEIRGKQVMLDSDLAKLYECKNGTKEINQAVKNNPLKFPERFCFKLTDEESQNLLVKIFDQKRFYETRGGKFKNPKVFTEQGVAMLATILKTKQATITSIQIMDAFVLMRKFIGNNNYNQRISNIETKLIDYDNKFDLIFDKLENNVNNHIFFNGQIYDAYSLLLDIFDSSKDTIVVIDNYVDKKLFDLLSKTNKKIKVYTSNIDNELINKYQKQYNNVTIIKSDNFHDRFIIIDNKILYHSEASFKDLGKKCFAINKIEDENILKKLLEVINDE